MLINCLVYVGKPEQYVSFSFTNLYIGNELSYSVFRAIKYGLVSQ